MQEEGEGGDAAEACLRGTICVLLNLSCIIGLFLKCLQGRAGREHRVEKEVNKADVCIASSPFGFLNSSHNSYRAMATASSSRAPEPEAFLTRQHILFALRCLKFLPTPYQAEDSNRCALLPLPLDKAFLNSLRRMSLAYFCLSALALLPGAAASSADADGEASALEVMLKPKAKSGYADWVYAQQLGSGGFRGSDSMEGTASDPRAGTTYAPLSLLSPTLADGAGSSALDAIPLNDEEAEEFARLMAFPDDVDDLPPRGAEESPLSPAHLIQSYTALLVLALLSDDFTRLDRQALLRFVARCQNDDGS